MRESLQGRLARTARDMVQLSQNTCRADAEGVLPRPDPHSHLWALAVIEARMQGYADFLTAADRRAIDDTLAMIARALERTFPALGAPAASVPADYTRVYQAAFDVEPTH